MAAAATSAKTLVLITGASGGIGFELAAQLMEKGSYHVLLGSRSVEKGNAAVRKLQTLNLPGSVQMIPIDVTDDDAIERAATTVQHDHGRLDVLINNAGIGAPTPPLRQQMREAFDTNATGPAVITNVFAPLLRLSTSPRIMNVSSGAGSINRRLDLSSPIYKMQEMQYRASKAALNMITACQWVEYTPAGFKVFAYDPGFTQSNLSPHNTPENGAKTAKDAVLPLIDILEGKRDDEAGKLLHNTGMYPW